MKFARFTTTALFVFLTLAISTTAFAQRPGGGPPGGRLPGGGPPRGGVDHRPPPRGQRPPLGPQADFLSSEMRFGDRTVKGSPYSAQFSTESTQVLADGTRITRKSNGAVYRNGEGRTRREQALGAVGPIPMEGAPRQLIFINDPVGGAHYVLDVQDHSVRKLPFRDAPPGPVGQGGPAGPPPEFADSPDPVKTESLGKQVIEGVEAEGTRSTITIPAGRIGNDRPLQIVSERWFSPELQIVVLSKHNDPFAGENVYRLSSISRDEPSLKLFEVPADYRVTEERPPDMQRRPKQ